MIGYIPGPVQRAQVEAAVAASPPNCPPELEKDAAQSPGCVSEWYQVLSFVHSTVRLPISLFAIRVATRLNLSHTLDGYADETS